MARTHSHGGVVCEHPTIKACTAARRLAMGQCSAMKESKSDPEPCTNWAVDTVEDRGYCGQHVASMLSRAIEARRKQERVDRIGRSIAHFMAWNGVFPSIWDKFPDDWMSRLPDDDVVSS